MNELEWNETYEEAVFGAISPLVLVGKHGTTRAGFSGRPAAVQGGACSVPITWKIYWNELNLCLLLVFEVRSQLQVLQIWLKVDENLSPNMREWR